MYYYDPGLYGYFAQNGNSPWWAASLVALPRRATSSPYPDINWGGTRGAKHILTPPCVCLLYMNNIRTMDSYDIISINQQSRHITSGDIICIKDYICYNGDPVPVSASTYVISCICIIYCIQFVEHNYVSWDSSSHSSLRRLTSRDHVYHCVSAFDIAFDITLAPVPLLSCDICVCVILV